MQMRQDQKVLVEDCDTNWKRGFIKYSKALSLLRECSPKDADKLTTSEMLALIKGFEVCYDLALDMLYDYLASQHTRVDEDPREILRQAFACKIVADGQAWMDMVPLYSETIEFYSDRLGAFATEHILTRFLPAFEELNEKFAGFCEEVAKD